jgi:hypothetical protein
MKVKMGWKLYLGNTRNMHTSLFGKFLRRRILGGQRKRKVNVKLEKYFVWREDGR